MKENDVVRHGMRIGTIVHIYADGETACIEFPGGITEDIPIVELSKEY